MERRRLIEERATMEEPPTGRADGTRAGTSRRSGDQRKGNHCNAKVERGGDRAWDIERWRPWKTEGEEGPVVVVAVVVAAAAAAAHCYDSRWAVFARP